MSLRPDPLTTTRGVTPRGSTSARSCSRHQPLQPDRFAAADGDTMWLHEARRPRGAAVWRRPVEPGLVVSLQREAAVDPRSSSRARAPIPDHLQAGRAQLRPALRLGSRVSTRTSQHPVANRPGGARRASPGSPPGRGGDAGRLVQHAERRRELAPWLSASISRVDCPSARLAAQRDGDGGAPGAPIGPPTATNRPRGRPPGPTRERRLGRAQPIVRSSRARSSTAAVTVAARSVAGASTAAPGAHRAAASRAPRPPPRADQGDPATSCSANRSTACRSSRRSVHHAARPSRHRRPTASLPGRRSAGRRAPGPRTVPSRDQCASHGPVTAVSTAASPAGTARRGSGQRHQRDPGPRRSPERPARDQLLRPSGPAR